MELELKHLAPYLPYGLNTKYELYNVIGEIGEIAPQKNEVRDKKLTTENVDFVLEYCKPILRPLSDLTKEIEVNDEKFTPIVSLYNISRGVKINKFIEFDYVKSWGGKNILRHDKGMGYYTNFIYSKHCFHKDTEDTNRKIRYSDSIENQYFLHEFLFEHNFDIFGLIEKGLAIDINTLNK